MMILWQTGGSLPLRIESNSIDMPLTKGGGVGLIWDIPPDQHGKALNLTRHFSHIQKAGFLALSTSPLLSLPSVDATTYQHEHSTPTEDGRPPSSTGAMDEPLSEPAPDGAIATRCKTLGSMMRRHPLEEADRSIGGSSSDLRRYG